MHIGINSDVDGMNEVGWSEGGSELEKERVSEKLENSRDVVASSKSLNT